MAIADIQSSFGAGELSPSLYGRVDLAKYEVGAALLRNFLVDYRGGVRYRPGTRFIAGCKDLTTVIAPKLIPFIVSTDASYVLEVGNLYIRVYSLGTLIQEVVTPYITADIETLNWAQSADVMTLVHPSYPPANLTRTSPTTFVYSLVTTGSSIGAVTNGLAVFTNSPADPFFYGYIVTAISLDGKEESIPSSPLAAGAQYLDETAQKMVYITWNAPAQPASRYNIYKYGPIKKTFAQASVWGLIGSTQATEFTDNNIAPDFTKEAPQFQDPFSGGQIQQVTVTGGGSGYSGSGGAGHNPYVPLTFTGDGTGAAGYGLVEDSSHTIVACYLTNPGKNYTTVTITCVGSSGSGATFSSILSDITPLYPSCVAYLQQRRCFAASNIKPETIVLSQTGNYTNFDTTPISLATDAISISLASLEVNHIQSMVPVAYGMIAFTTGGTFLINGGSPGAAITPSSITSQAQASEGASSILPLRINYDVLYIQNKGNRVRDLAFAWQRQSYTGSDISSLAAHLFDSFSTIDWCWAQEPFKVVNAVRNDGKLLMCTYVPDQEVYAWTRHDTQGLFKSVTSIPEGDINAVYCIVQRPVEGVWSNYLERFQPSDCCIYDAWFLDSAQGTAWTATTTDLFLLAETFTLGTPFTLPVGSVLLVSCALIKVTARVGDIFSWALLGGSLDGLRVPGDNADYFPIRAGDWSWTTPSAAVTGLAHLEGMSVMALADGLVEGPFIVTSGVITLPRPASSVVVGLSYTGQIQTLYLNIEGLQPGTMQGKRKLQPAVTLRLDCSRGLECGIDFDHLSPVTDENVPYSVPGELMTGDIRHIIFSDWNTEGQICIQQTLPLPATVLGIIAEVVAGDTVR